MKTSRVRILQVALSSFAGAGCLPSAPVSPTNGPVYFDPDIQATMDVVGCSTGGCHGEQGTPMHVVPPAQGGSVDQNYREVQPRTSGAAQSLFLTKPTIGDASDHGGGKLIPMNGLTYNQWLAWIQAGAPLRAPVAAPPPGSGAPNVDGGAPNPAPAPPPDGGVTACSPPQVTLKQSHYAGQDCLSCHAIGQSAVLRWTIAGTLFQDKFGSTTRGGATILLIDALGTPLSLVTDAEGNFYTAQPVKFPLTVSASACPSTKAMAGKVMSGNCNATACHDASLPAYLP